MSHLVFFRHCPRLSSLFFVSWWTFKVSWSTYNPEVFTITDPFGPCSPCSIIHRWLSMFKSEICLETQWLVFCLCLFYHHHTCFGTLANCISYKHQVEASLWTLSDGMQVKETTKLTLPGLASNDYRGLVSPAGTCTELHTVIAKKTYTLIPKIY